MQHPYRREDSVNGSEVEPAEVLTVILLSDPLTERKYKQPLVAASFSSVKQVKG
jgi:hypothetical protein